MLNCNITWCSIASRYLIKWTWSLHCILMSQRHERTFTLVGLTSYNCCCNICRCRIYQSFAVYTRWQPIVQQRCQSLPAMPATPSFICHESSWVIFTQAVMTRLIHSVIKSSVCTPIDTSMRHWSSFAPLSVRTLSQFIIIKSSLPDSTKQDCQLIARLPKQKTTDNKRRV